MKRRADQRLRGIRILHEDDDLIVIEKAAGVLAQQLGDKGLHCVESALTDYVRKGQARSPKRVYLVHRLDRDTSGVMMVAKNETVQQFFRNNWSELTKKTYLALVEGALEAESGKFESYLAEDEKHMVRSVEPPAGKYACTIWRRLRTAGSPPRTLVEIDLPTGRKNQIRVHFAESGHPVAGDEKYGAAPRRPRLGRGAPPKLALHAWRLEFTHPRTGRAMRFETPLPAFAGEKIEL